jgi:hypothetical protein
MVYTLPGASSRIQQPHQSDLRLILFGLPPQPLLVLPGCKCLPTLIIGRHSAQKTDPTLAIQEFHRRLPVLHICFGNCPCRRSQCLGEAHCFGCIVVEGSCFIGAYIERIGFASDFYTSFPMKNDARVRSIFATMLLFTLEDITLALPSKWVSDRRALAFLASKRLR